jgi:hypothetical protein
MAATSYDGTCKNCDSNLAVWIEVRKNIDGIPIPEVWCINCIRGEKSDKNHFRELKFISYLVNFLTNYNRKRSLLLQSKFTY